MTESTGSRRAFLRNAGLSVLMSQLAGVMKAAEGAKRPNFVLIFLDDSGWADFHPFGNPAYRTPKVEALAHEGRRSS